MTLKSSITIFAVGAIACFTAMSCNSSAPTPTPPAAPSGAGTDVTSAEASGIVTPTPTPDATCLTGGLGLDAAVTYDDNVQQILTNNCISCHNATGTAPDLSTYTSALAAAQQSASDIASGKMPTSGALDAADQATFQAWIADGTPESQTTVAATSTCATTAATVAATTAATTTSTVATPTISPLQALLNPPMLATCAAQGKVYDRAALACSQANVATSYACTDAGIRAEFLKIGISADAQITGYEAQGYVIDQCGELNGDVLVTFYRTVTSGTTTSLLPKKVCKSGSPLCS